MNLVSVLLSLLPVGVIFLLLTLRKTPADIAGVIGWILTVFLAATWFGTAPAVIARSSLAGIVASFPISLVVAASIFQMTLMWETGSMARIMTLIKSLSPRDQVVQIMLINVGFATLLTSLGAVPVSTLPPIMLALGYSSFAAIALPAIGYDALCTYAMLGVPAVVFADVITKVTGTPTDVNEVGIIFARYMPIISTCIGLGMLWIIGRGKMMIKGFIPTLLAGLTAGFVAIGMAHAKMVTLTGIAAGIGVIIVMFAYLAIAGKPLRDRSVLNAADLEAEKRMGLLAAMSPWLILIFFSVLVNLNLPGLPLKTITFKNWAMPIELVPKKPENLRFFWQAYTWVLMSSLLAIPFLKPTQEQLRSTLAKTWKRAPRPVLAAAIFFAIAYVCNHSGKNAEWVLNPDPNMNMVSAVAGFGALAFGKAYPLIAPYLGLFCGFISGSETSAIAMVTALHLSTAGKIGAVGIVIAAASAIGGGLASVISPAKLQNAAASIDKIGEEGKVIPVTFGISIVITGVCALMTLIWAFA